MAFFSDVRFDVVSIRPTELHLGVTLLEPQEFTDEERGAVGRSIHNLPAEMRRKHELNALILLAGSIGGMLATDSGFIDDAVDDELALENVQVLREGVGLDQLGERERLLLAAAESRDDAPPTDWDQTFNLGMYLGNEDERLARSYLGWLRHVAARYVVWPPFRRGLDATVPVLLQRDVIPGDEAWSYSPRRRKGRERQSQTGRDAAYSKGALEQIARHDPERCVQLREQGHKARGDSVGTGQRPLMGWTPVTRILAIGPHDVCTGYRRCVTPTPSTTSGSPRTIGVVPRWSNSRTPSPSNTAARSTWISSSNPASRSCWIVFAPCTATDRSPAAVFACATALSMPSVTKWTVEPGRGQPSGTSWVTTNAGMFHGC
jgi:hypothetical protein